MTIRFNCPDCGRNLEQPDDAAGKKVSCPDCRRPIDVPVMGSVVRFLGRTMGNGLASAPIVLGSFALFFCWVPILGAMMAMPLGFLGIALGVLGFPVGVLRSRQAMMRSLGGIALCVLAILASFLSTGVLMNHLKNQANQAGPRQQQPTTRAFTPDRPRRPRDARVMTIDGHRADAQVDPPINQVQGRMATSPEKTSPRKPPAEKPSSGAAASQPSTSGGTKGP